MRIDSLMVVASEQVAFITWLLHFSKFKEIKYKLFVVYLGIIATNETFNLIFYTSQKCWSNWLVTQINPPLQFIFFIYFLLYKKNKLSHWIVLLFVSIYLQVLFMERLGYFVSPKNFNSLSYGVGDLLLIITIIISLINLFRHFQLADLNQKALFWIILGLILYYIGAFPYQNFKNFFWSKPAYYNTAYLLLYLSQTFSCTMYLIFTYSIKWKIK